ncbi:unnamed protein product, partial [Closterium sp. NIES-53]
LRQFNEVVAQENSRSASLLASSNHSLLSLSLLARLSSRLLNAVPSINPAPASSLQGPSPSVPFESSSTPTALTSMPGAVVGAAGDATVAAAAAVEPSASTILDSQAKPSDAAAAAAAAVGASASTAATQQPSPSAFHEILPDGWYGTVLLLGFDDGCPILTF